LNFDLSFSILIFDLYIKNKISNIKKKNYLFQKSYCLLLDSFLNFTLSFSIFIFDIFIPRSEK